MKQWSEVGVVLCVAFWELFLGFLWGACVEVVVCPFVVGVFFGVWVFGWFFFCFGSIFFHCLDICCLLTPVWYRKYEWACLPSQCYSVFLSYFKTGDFGFPLSSHKLFPSISNYFHPSLTSPPPFLITFWRQFNRIKLSFPSKYAQLIYTVQLHAEQGLWLKQSQWRFNLLLSSFHSPSTSLSPQNTNEKYIYVFRTEYNLLWMSDFHEQVLILNRILLLLSILSLEVYWTCFLHHSLYCGPLPTWYQNCVNHDALTFATHIHYIGKKDDTINRRKQVSNSLAKCLCHLAVKN